MYVYKGNWQYGTKQEKSHRKCFSFQYFHYSCSTDDLILVNQERIQMHKFGILFLNLEMRVKTS